MDIKKTLQGRVSFEQKKLSELKTQNSVIAATRTIVFILFIALIYFFASSDLWFLLSLAIGAGVFIALIIKYNKNQDLTLFHKNLLQISEEELRRCSGDFEGFDDGHRFSSPTHSYTHDLDVFGEKSLFQQFNRCNTLGGKEILSSWLRQEPNVEQAKRRQDLIKEVSQDLHWVHCFLANTRSKHTEKHDFSSLSQIKPHGILVAIVKVLFPIAAIALLILASIGGISWSFFMLSFVINFAVLVNFNQRMIRLGLKTDHLLTGIQLYISGLQQISQSKFQNAIMQKEREQITALAIREIKKLKKLVNLLDARSNVFYGLFNGVLLIDLYLFDMLRTWNQRNQFRIPEWADAVHRMEAYLSLVSYSMLHPEFTFPIFSQAPFTLNGLAIGHPLIDTESRVKNDFDLSSAQLFLVTGSNMSGKSTFLRTIAVNLIMAYAGLPVCAKKFTASPFLIFTSMRTQDDLAEHTSSFYAEIKRIRSLLDQIDGSEMATLFFLDEILKGTNSVDRHLGAQGLIQRLIHKNCKGFISTHDLQLADEYEKDPHVKNYSFNSELINDELLFDYKLTSGKCQNTNASALMRKMGIVS